MEKINKENKTDRKPSWLEYGEKLARMNANKGILFPYIGSRADTKYRIGKIINGGGWIGLPESASNTVGIGIPGSGKTYKMWQDGIIRKNNGEIVVYIDFIKKSYDGLINYFDDSYVMRVETGDLRLNPLFPQGGLSKERWIDVICPILEQGFGLMGGYGTSNYLRKKLVQLYDIFGDKTPCIIDLYEFVLADRVDRQSEDFVFRQRLVARLELMVWGLGKCINVEKGFSLEDLFTKARCLVLEIGTSVELAGIFARIFMKAALIHLIHTKNRRLTFYCDEAKHLFSEAHEYRIKSSGEVSSLASLVTTAREYSVSTFFCEQDVNYLNRSILTSSHTHILFMSNGNNIIEMSRIMGLSREQTEFCYTGLETGIAVVKRCSFPPVCVRIPYVELNKNVTDEQVKERLKNLNLSFTPRSDFIKTRLSEEKRETKEEKNSEEFLFMTLIARRPEIEVTQRYELQGLSRSKGDRLKNSLITRGLVRDIIINKGRGGRPTLLELTEKGEFHLQSKGYSLPIRKWRGGVAHYWWQLRVKEWLERQGCHIVEIEKAISGGLETKYIDVFGRGEKTFAVEIEISEPRFENLEKLSLHGFDVIIIAADKVEALDGIKKKAEDEFGAELFSRIKFWKLTEFLK